MTLSARTTLLLSCSASLLLGLGGTARSQSATPAPSGAAALPGIEVVAPNRAPPSRRPRTPVTTRRRRETPAAPTPQTEAQVVAGKNEKFDETRRNIVAATGAGSYELNQQALEALPQGTNTPSTRYCCRRQAYRRTRPRAANLHVRNEHANLQYRINGIMLPDGVGAFGQILDTGIVGSLALITGALPAQYGLRTAGVLDIQTKADAFNNSGSVSVYGGSHGTITTKSRIWRHGRTDPVLRFRPLFRQRSRNRKSDAVVQRHSRQNVAGKGISLSFDGDRSDQPPDLSSAASRTAAIKFPIIPARHRPSPPSAFPISIPRCSTNGRTSSTSSTWSPTRNPAMASTTSSPISTATASCISCPTRSATWFSMAWPRMFIVRASSTAFRKTLPGASASRTR